MCKVMKSEEQYDLYLDEIEALIELESEQGSKEQEKLELLTLLIKDYEERHYKFEYPDPIEAIKFRMEQQGLKQKDLVQYIGSKSKVSEVLNRKKDLSLNMIRALHKGLGIPAEVLLQKDDTKELTETSID